MVVALFLRLIVVTATAQLSVKNNYKPEKMRRTTRAEFMANITAYEGRTLPSMTSAQLLALFDANGDGAIAGTEAPNPLKLSSLTLTGPLEFRNISVEMAPNAAITGEAFFIGVPPFPALTLDNARLYACSDMWAGISMRNCSLTVKNGSKIEHALTAVRGEAAATLTLTGSTFNENRTHVELIDVIVAPFVMTGCTLSCDAALRHPHGGQRTRTGVKISNSGAISDLGLTDLTLGAAGGTSVNTFRNMETGVDANVEAGGRVRLYRCLFTQGPGEIAITDGVKFAGPASGTGPAPNLQLLASQTGGNVFANVVNPVSAQRAFLGAGGCIVFATQGYSRDGILADGQNLNGTGAGISDCQITGYKNCVAVRRCKSSVSVQNNVLNPKDPGNLENSHGILLERNPKIGVFVSGNAVGNAWNAVRGVGIKIHHYGGDGFPETHVVVENNTVTGLRYGIRADGVSAGRLNIDGNTVTNCAFGLSTHFGGGLTSVRQRFMNNAVSGTYKGIITSSTGHTGQTLVQNNTITGVGPHPAVNDVTFEHGPVGIHLRNTFGAEVRNNAVTGGAAGMTFSLAALLEAAPYSVLCDNRLKNCFIGLTARGFSALSHVNSNRIYGAYAGAYLWNNGVFGRQGGVVSGSTVTNENLWGAGVYFPTAATASDGSLSPIFHKSATGTALFFDGTPFYENPAAVPQAAANPNPCFELLGGPCGAGLYNPFTLSATATTGNFLSACGPPAPPGGGGGFSDRTAPDLENVISGAHGGISHPATADFVAKQTVYAALSLRPEYADESPVLADFYATASASNIGAVHRVHEKAAAGDYARAKLENDAIIPATLPVWNHKVVAGIALELALDESPGLTPGRVADLVEVAKQCPLAGGNAVYAARDLLPDSVEYVPDPCGVPMLEFQPAPEARKAAPETPMERKEGLSVYPNPARDVLWVEYRFGETRDFAVRLYDLAGRCVGETRASGKAGKASLSAAALPEGLYTLKIEFSDGETLFQKVSVVK